MPSMAGLTRREFLFLGVAAGATAGVGIVVPLTLIEREGAVGETAPAAAAVVATFPRRRIASLRALDGGRPVAFDYPGDGQTNYVVKLGRPSAAGIGPESDVVAYSRICTHMGCVVDEFDAATSTLGPCPCHFSTFDFAKDGDVVLGQATQSLPRVLMEVEGDDVVATGMLRLIYGYRNSLLDVELVGTTS